MISATQNRFQAQQNQQNFGKKIPTKLVADAEQVLAGGRFTEGKNGTMVSRWNKAPLPLFTVTQPLMEQGKKIGNIISEFSIKKAFFGGYKAVKGATQQLVKEDEKGLISGESKVLSKKETETLAMESLQGVVDASKKKSAETETLATESLQGVVDASKEKTISKDGLVLSVGGVSITREPGSEAPFFTEKAMQLMHGDGIHRIEKGLVDKVENILGNGGCYYESTDGLMLRSTSLTKNEDNPRHFMAKKNLPNGEGGSITTYFSLQKKGEDYVVAPGATQMIFGEKCNLSFLGDEPTRTLSQKESEEFVDSAFKGLVEKNKERGSNGFWHDMHF